MLLYMQALHPSAAGKKLQGLPVGREDLEDHIPVTARQRRRRC